MQHYLAFAWTAADHEARNEAAAWSARLAESGDWARTFHTPGLDVWVTGRHRLAVRTLGAHGAVLLGEMYDRGGAPSVCVPGLSADPLAAARRLSADVWGRYVALLPGEDGAELWAFRDPSGALNAYSWRLGKVSALADDVTALPFGVAPPRLALDWDAITEIFRRPIHTTHLSPLAGFTPIAPGDLQLVGGAAPAVGVWRPAAFARRERAIEPAELRDTVLATVSALASRHPRLLAEVSGGLDSAIVAGALVETGHRARVVGCVNHYADQREGDERAWAEAVCARAGLPLDTAPFGVRTMEVAEFDALARCIGPAYSGLDAPLDARLAAWAERHGADAIFTGEGGDAVFYQMPTVALVADRIGGRGWLGLGDPFVREVARRFRRSVWSVMREALRPQDWPDPAPVAASTRFWGPRAWAAPRSPVHPWLSGLGDVAPGKQVQIRALAGSQDHWSRSLRAGAAAIVQPLLAQPVVELCLAAPSWTLVRGGRDRALAREAFAGLVPESILQRRWKGAVSAFYAQSAAASRDVLRTHLLEGVLVDAGVLDGRAVEAALEPDELIWRDHGARMVRAAILESWVRHWQTRVPDLASAQRWRMA